jgi:hypothetical protein
MGRDRLVYIDKTKLKQIVIRIKLKERLHHSRVKWVYLVGWRKISNYLL